MKQFLYLDMDIIASIIAQSEKGLITQMMHEDGFETGTEKQKSASANANARGRLKLWKFSEVEAALGGEARFGTAKSDQSSTKEIVEKTLHDAAFDIAYSYAKPIVVEYGNQNNDDGGSYLEIKRVFDFVDFDYLEGLFEKNGVVDFIKKNTAEQIEEAGKLTAGRTREELRRAGINIKSELKKAITISNKQYDDVASIIHAFRGLIPYSRMLISHDGYLVPLDDKFFRIDPSSLGFKYGGEMTCVGMVTNIIGESTDPADSNNIFASLQYTANEMLRKILPSTQSDLCVIHPIAVYYGN